MPMKETLIRVNDSAHTDLPDEGYKEELDDVKKGEPDMVDKSKLKLSL